MKTDGLFIQKLVVNYDGKKYSANPIVSLGYAYDYDLANITINTIPSEVASIGDMEETDTTISLKLGKIIFNLDSAGNATFTPEYNKVISFDKTTLRGTGDKLNPEDIPRGSNQNLINMIIIEYINKVCSCNENVYNYLRKKHTYLTGILNRQTETKNIINLVTFNLLEFEKLINSNNDKILEESIGDKNFELNEASKLHQVVGLPKVAISAIKELKLEFALNEIKKLAETIDGNSLKIFFEFFQNLKILLKASDNYHKEANICKFIGDFTEVSKKGYRTPDLLNFILKQNFYYSSSGIFTFPFDELGFLKDYIHMSEIYGIKVEKYPSQLKKQHDILAKNVSFLDKMSPELEKQFKDAVSKYEYVEREVTVAYPCKKGEIPEKETYVFITPKKIKDIIQEGNDLHHCVGSYSDRIINNESRIVFMRLKGKEKESLVTIDISDKNTLIEAAGNGNGELTDIQDKALRAWLKEISK